MLFSGVAQIFRDFWRFLSRLSFWMYFDLKTICTCYRTDRVVIEFDFKKSSYPEGFPFFFREHYGSTSSKMKRYSNARVTLHFGRSAPVVETGEEEEPMRVFDQFQHSSQSVQIQHPGFWLISENFDLWPPLKLTNFHACPWSSMAQGLANALLVRRPQDTSVCKFDTSVCKFDTSVRVSSTPLCVWVRHKSASFRHLCV